ncbi:MORN repeat-containing protein 3 [Caerostris darwini]|uniref:MORN repeat-containing protein 3 n=1 Tax=Caerostris darwini TaxID=1538125 RepID=A0AAV4QGJ3_9ARAC|nr:MORN repeat-containing protein 3 [Caerostris darwini]
MLNVLIRKKSDSRARRSRRYDRNGRYKRICDENGDLFSGQWKNNEKHGFGTLEGENDGIVYEGSWDKNKKDGKGRMHRKDSLFQFIYNGNWKKNKRNGEGAEFYGDGGRYQGGWRRDAKSGFGRMDYADGSTYVGHWKDDEKAGFGKMWYADGATYEGCWRDDRKDGKGILITAEKNRHEGCWRRDLKHGEGRKHVHENGMEFAGLWMDSYLCCGTVEVTDPDAPFPMKAEIPEWTLRNPKEVLDNAKEYYRAKAAETDHSTPLN